MLMHGDEVKAIEASLDIDFGDLVDNMGKLAWTCILNQFVPVLVGKHPIFAAQSPCVHDDGRLRSLACWLQAELRQS
jgi:hypothetical protein